MTRKQASRIERNLKACGVYRPYVEGDKEAMYIESYPLNVIIRDGQDGLRGPFQSVRVNDSTLPRLGQDATVAEWRVYFGQDLCSHVSALLASLHPVAYARAKEQDSAALERAGVR
jgi:hypothetical protein